MAPSKKKTKNILETINDEDKIKLIKVCYTDKLVYGHVRWKEFDNKIFSNRQSINDFKNIWRLLNKNFDNLREEHNELLTAIEKEAAEMSKKNKKEKKKKKSDTKINKQSTTVTSPRSPLANISLVRNFSKYNSSFVKNTSNFFSPLNNSINKNFTNKNFTNKSSFSSFNKKNTFLNEKKGSNLNVKYDFTNNKMTSGSKIIHYNNSNTNIKYDSTSFSHLKSNITKGISRNQITNIDYIKRNIDDVKKKSEFLDFYFLIISFIYHNKPFALLKKIEEFYNMKLLKSCNTENAISNNYILYIVTKVYEICSTMVLIKSGNTFAKMDTGIRSASSFCHDIDNWEKEQYSRCETAEKWSNKWVNYDKEHIYSKNIELEKGYGSKNFASKNVVTIETKDKTFQFNKNVLNYKLLYNILKKNVHLKNSKALFFLIPLPTKPNNLLFKNNKFYYHNKLVSLDTIIDEDIYNYVYIFQKFFISFWFWTSFIKIKGVEEMKIMFTKELEELYNIFYKEQTPKKEEKRISPKEYISKKKQKLKNVNIKYTLLTLDFDINNIIVLCFYVFKMFKNAKRRINIDFLKIVKIFDLCLKPKTQKKILRHYVKITFIIYYIIKKLERIHKNKMNRKKKKEEKNRKEMQTKQKKVSLGAK